MRRPFVLKPKSPWDATTGATSRWVPLDTSTDESAVCVPCTISVRTGRESGIQAAASTDSVSSLRSGRGGPPSGLTTANHHAYDDSGGDSMKAIQRPSGDHASRFVRDR